MAITAQIDPNLKPERIDTYKYWQAEQKIPVVHGFFVEDVNTLPLEHWDLKGVPCSMVVLDGTGGTNDAYVCEIPAGGKTKPQKHMYEEMVYVTQGYGATSVWQRDGKKHTFEWGPGSMFAMPLNADYQHFNASGSEAARYFAVTNCCFMMNLFHNVDYIFNSDYSFLDRFDPRTEGYFSGQGELTGRFFLTTNFVPDTHTLKLTDYSERGKGSTNMKFNLAKNTMGAHISEFPVGTYKKGHKHGPGRARDHSRRSGLFDSLAAGRRAAARRLETGQRGGASGPVVSPALQLGRGAGALSGAALEQLALQVHALAGRRGRHLHERQTGRRADRVRRRGSANPSRLRSGDENSRRALQHGLLPSRLHV